MMPLVHGNPHNQVIEDRKPFLHTLWAYVDVKKIRNEEIYQATLRINSTDSKCRRSAIVRAKDVHQLRKEIFKEFDKYIKKDVERLGHPMSHCTHESKIYRTVEIPKYLQSRVLDQQVRDFPNILDVSKTLTENGIANSICEFDKTTFNRNKHFVKTKGLLIDGVLCEFATVVKQTLISMGKTELADSIDTKREA